MRAKIAAISILAAVVVAHAQDAPSVFDDAIADFQDLDRDGLITPLERSIQVWWDVQLINEQHRLMVDLDGLSLLDRMLAYSRALFGDLDGDGVVDESDILYMVQHVGVAEPTLPEGDLNNDGSVDGMDLLLLLEAQGNEIGLTDDQLADGLMDLMSIYLDSDPSDIGDMRQLPPRISIRCYRIPNIPGAAHCALYDGDNARVCGVGPQLAVPLLGCIRGGCGPYGPYEDPNVTVRRSQERAMEDSCTGDPLRCFRVTPIVCPDRQAADALMQCVSDYMTASMADAPAITFSQGRTATRLFTKLSRAVSNVLGAAVRSLTTAATPERPK